MTKILKLPQVMEATALSRSSIYAYIKAQKFPAQILIGVKAVGAANSGLVVVAMRVA